MEEVKLMQAEILSTGDEICQGTFIDTNSAHIAACLNDIGLRVARHQCVGDDIEALTAVFSEIGARADIAIITGGLGPTVDDLSAQAAARAAGVDLVLDRAAENSIKDYFAKFSRTMSPSDIKQAMLPLGAMPILNFWGTAPGFIITLGRCRCYFLPGVPREMEALLGAMVIPDILSFIGKTRNVFIKKELSVFGLPEALVDAKLKGFGDRFPGIKLGMVARFPVITVKMTAQGNDPNHLAEELEKAAEWSARQLDDKVFSFEGRSMEAEVARLLLKQKATLAVAESCTGGLVSHLLTNIAGSSDYFLFSGVTYANQAKQAVLGVSDENLRKFGAVSEQIVREMAEGARRISGAVYGLATSGIAGPSGGSPEKPVGTLCIAVSSQSGTVSRILQSPFKERLSNKQIFAICALDMLRKELLKKAA